MTKPALCRYCKKPIGEHVIGLHDDAPRVGVIGEDGRPSWCSDYEAEKRAMYAEARQMHTLVRSLRWRASHIERRGVDASDYLRKWADETAVRVERWLRHIEEHY